MTVSFDQRNLLPQRPSEILTNLGVDEFIAADHVAGLERVVVGRQLPLTIARRLRAGMILSGRDCPNGLQVAFPIAVEAAPPRRKRNRSEGRAEPAAGPPPFPAFSVSSRRRQFEVARVPQVAAGPQPITHSLSLRRPATRQPAGSLRKAPLPRFGGVELFVRRIVESRRRSACPSALQARSKIAKCGEWPCRKFRGGRRSGSTIQVWVLSSPQAVPALPRR